MSYQALQQAVQARRSVYALNKELPVSVDEVNDIVKHAILHSPSSFNSQSSRVVVLHADEHEKLWDLTSDALQAIVPAEQFANTKQKLDSFKAAAGTVLFFEDTNVVKGLQEKFALYADNFPIWSEHASAIVQYVIWTTLSAAGVGANLQHYNPVIDEAVAKQWGVDGSWKLRAQLVFGGIQAPAGEKSFEPVDERVKIFG